MSDIRFGPWLDESTDMDAYAATAELEWAWRQWVMESCVERHSDHLWMLWLKPPDPEYSSSLVRVALPNITLACTYCGATLEDLGYCDGDCLVFGEVDGIRIEHGHHRSLLPLYVPVTVDIECSSTYCHYYGATEYDVAIEVIQTGPAQCATSVDTP